MGNRTLFYKEDIQASNWNWLAQGIELSWQNSFIPLRNFFVYLISKFKIEQLKRSIINLHLALNCTFT